MNHKIDIKVLTKYSKKESLRSYFIQNGEKKLCGKEKLDIMVPTNS